MKRKKQENLGIRTTTRRMELLRKYAEMVEKSQTQVLEDFIDSLEEKVKEKEDLKITE